MQDLRRRHSHIPYHPIAVSRSDSARTEPPTNCRDTQDPLGDDSACPSNVDGPPQTSRCQSSACSFLNPSALTLPNAERAPTSARNRSTADTLPFIHPQSASFVEYQRLDRQARCWQTVDQRTQGYGVEPLASPRPSCGDRKAFAVEGRDNDVRNVREQRFAFPVDQLMAKRQSHRI